MKRYNIAQLNGADPREGEYFIKRVEGFDFYLLVDVSSIYSVYTLISARIESFALLAAGSSLRELEENLRLNHTTKVDSNPSKNGTDIARSINIAVTYILDDLTRVKVEEDKAARHKPHKQVIKLLQGEPTHLVAFKAVPTTPQHIIGLEQIGEVGTFEVGYPYYTEPGLYLFPVYSIILRNKQTKAVYGVSSYMVGDRPKRSSEIRVIHGRDDILVAGTHYN